MWSLSKAKRSKGISDAMPALLSVEDYDAAERAGMEQAPNRIIECSRAAVFGHEGYPIRVTTLKSLWRYADAMHDGRALATFQDLLLGGVTDAEFELLRIVTRGTVELTEKAYGRRMVATGSLLRALLVFRHIAILHPERDATVLEIGPGSGYVGALLVSAGFRYVATDIAQGFYLYQNHLLNAVAPNGVTELATDERSFATFDSIPQGHALHVPWWKFMTPEPRSALGVNVVTCNHALAEMHVHALSYALKFSRTMLTQVGGAFLFEGWGSTVLRPIWTVAKRFADLGYTIAHNDVGASVFVPSELDSARGGLVLPQPCRTDAVRDVAAYPEAAFVGMYHPPIYTSPNNPISAKLTAGREDLQSRFTRGFSDIEEMWRSELGRDDVTSDDLRFLQYVGSL